MKRAIQHFPWWSYKTTTGGGGGSLLKDVSDMEAESRRYYMLACSGGALISKGRLKTFSHGTTSIVYDYNCIIQFEIETEYPAVQKTPAPVIGDLTGIWNSSSTEKES